jgi:acyl-coenzyme A thioesterase PaaI-like protein
MVLREPPPPNPDFAETTKRFLMEMPIARHFGFAITDVGPGLFEITQPFRKELSFSQGIFQAGPVGTLADMAAACAGVTMLPRGWRLYSGLHDQAHCTRGR